MKAFAEKFSDAVIYASDYVGYQLEGILDGNIGITHVREKMKICLGEETVDIGVVPNAGKGSSLSAEYNGINFNSAEEMFTADAVDEEMSVAVIYVSGCDYTETVALEMAGGISDLGQLNAKPIDLNAVESIDTELKNVTVSGRFCCTIRYDRLIYACGAECGILLFKICGNFLQVADYRKVLRADKFALAAFQAVTGLRHLLNEAVIIMLVS